MKLYYDIIFKQANEDVSVCGSGGIGRRTRLRIWRVTVGVQVPSPAPLEIMTPVRNHGGFLIWLKTYSSRIISDFVELGK